MCFVGRLAAKQYVNTGFFALAAQLQNEVEIIIFRRQSGSA